MDSSLVKDDLYLMDALLRPLRKCMTYRPAFGQGGREGLSVEQFQDLYGQDLFYSWLGLNDPLIYAAHKAAGGLTSVYRQLGVGCELLFRTILSRKLSLSGEQLDWSYEYRKPNRTSGVHKLDAKIAVSDLEQHNQVVFNAWLESAYTSVRTSKDSMSSLRGVVFEVRQGYKSADSKRQNADLRFGMRAYQEQLLPVFALLSSQISSPVARRYRSDGMLVLVGCDDPDPTVSTFAFFSEVIGFDLVSFFQRNSDKLKSEVHDVVAHLLTPS